MGHQHYSITIDIYTHVTDAKFEEEIDKFGLALGRNNRRSGGNRGRRGGWIRINDVMVKDVSLFLVSLIFIKMDIQLDFILL